MMPRLALLLASLALLAGAAVHAQPQQEHRVPGAAPRPDHRPLPAPRDHRLPPRDHRVPVVPRAPGVQLDQRYHHDHYYPRRGALLPALPPGSVGVAHGSQHYYFHGGVWFRPSGARFVVVVPPIGIVVPFLPPAYVTLWLGGAPYYYANGVYYATAPGPGYVVVAPPPGAEAAQPAPPPPPPKAPPEPVIYPRSGQSAAQTEADRRDCNRWATTQPAALADAEVFQRAVAACMDARGYSVR
jgi:hypothetical protein